MAGVEFNELGEGVCVKNKVMGQSRGLVITRFDSLLREIKKTPT